MATGVEACGGWSLAQYEKYLGTVTFALTLNIVADAYLSRAPAVRRVRREVRHLFAQLRRLIESGRYADDEVRAFLRGDSVGRSLFRWLALCCATRGPGGGPADDKWAAIIEKFLVFFAPLPRSSHQQPA